jgi:DUF218 domain
MLRKLYQCLARSDEARPGDLIVVLAGRFERKHYGLELYRAGIAPRLLLSVDRFEVSRMAHFPIAGMDELLSLRAATPPAARHFFVEVSAAGTRIEKAQLSRSGTYGEVAALRRYLHNGTPGRLIVVSTDVHLRRVAFTCARIFGREAAGFRYCAVPARLQQPLDADSWWRRRQDRRFVLSEMVKLAGYHVLRR